MEYIKISGSGPAAVGGSGPGGNLEVGDVIEPTPEQLQQWTAFGDSFMSRERFESLRGWHTEQWGRVELLRSKPFTVGELLQAGWVAE